MAPSCVPCSPMPSQHAFRSQRRHAAKVRQESTIFSLREELATVKKELLEWQQWWNAWSAPDVCFHNDNVSHYAYEGSDKWTCDTVLSELLAGGDSCANKALDVASTVASGLEPCANPLKCEVADDSRGMGFNDKDLPAVSSYLVSGSEPRASPPKSEMDEDSSCIGFDNHNIPVASGSEPCASPLTCEMKDDSSGGDSFDDSDSDAHNSDDDDGIAGGGKDDETKVAMGVWRNQLQKHCEFSMKLLKDPDMRWSEEEKETIVDLIERGIMLQKMPQDKLYKWAHRNCCKQFGNVMSKLVREKFSQE
mmetsp:Transcript_24762/g.43338  ORF Transcript_24762/g.43338 Transcript_24762/m.43338 type:complete len:307 (-) Transcript_24762:163-1083(-)